MTTSITTASELERDLLGMREYPPVLKQIIGAWNFSRRWPVLPGFILITLVFAGVFADFLATHDDRAGGIRDRHYPPIWMQDDRYDRYIAEGQDPWGCVWRALQSDPDEVSRGDTCPFHILGIKLWTMTMSPTAIGHELTKDTIVFLKKSYLMLILLMVGKKF